MSRNDWDHLSAEDQDDFVRPRDGPIDVREAPAAKRRNEGKLLSHTQVAGVFVHILKNRAEQNEISESIRLALPAPAPAQHATASEYPCGGDPSLANQWISNHLDAAFMPDQSQHWLTIDQMDQLV